MNKILRGILKAKFKRLNVLTFNEASPWFAEGDICLVNALDFKRNTAYIRIDTTVYKEIPINYLESVAELIGDL